MLLANIKKVAKEKNVTIMKIEEDCGFPKGSISHWDKSEPSYAKVKKVSEYLNVDINRII